MRLPVCLVALCLALAMPSAASAVPLLNELKIDAGGTDQPWEYIELRATPGEALSGWYVVVLEGDGTGAGTADFVYDLNGVNAGATGLVLIQAPADVNTGQLPYPVPAGTTGLTDAQLATASSGIENGTSTFLLVSSAGTPVAETTDYDANNDGVLEVSGWTVADAVSTFDDGVTDFTYGPRLSDLPMAATRFPDDLTASSAAAWYHGALPPSPSSALNYVDPRSANFPTTGILTPGARNADDNDGDGVDDAVDNCPATGNGDQANADGAPDGGDACDGDDDNDGLMDAGDNCPTTANANQLNADGAADGGDACDADDDNDGTGDGSDNCPLVANADQANADAAADGGNACDSDDDNDGVPDAQDAAPLDPAIQVAPVATATPGVTATATPTPTATATPTPKVTLVSVRRRARAVSATFTVNGSGRVRLALTARGLRVPPRSLNVTSGSRTVSLTLPARARAALRRRSVSATMRVTYTPTGGSPVSASRRLLLRRG